MGSNPGPRTVNQGGRKSPYEKKKMVEETKHTTLKGRRGFGGGRNAGGVLLGSHLIQPKKKQGSRRKFQQIGKNCAWNRPGGGREKPDRKTWQKAHRKEKQKKKHRNLGGFCWEQETLAQRGSQFL